MPSLPDVPDTYRLTFIQSFGGQECINVFYYRDVTATTFLPVNVAQGWWDAIKATWRALQPTSSSFLNLRVECEALFGAHPFGIYTIPVGEQQGLRAAATEWMPIFNAYTIKLDVGTRLTRPGSKRIAGLMEGDQSTGQLVAGTLTLLQNLANVLDNNFTPTGGGAAVTPVIVGYPTALQPGSPRVQDVTAAIASNWVGHQDTRDARP